MTRPTIAVAGVYAALCLALWPVPLLGLLHAESSAVVAGVGFFASGLGALALFRRGVGLRTVLGRMEALLVVPWALLTLSLLWRPNCGYGQGLLLFAVFTVPSVALAVALAFALDAMQVAWRRTAFVAIGLAVAVVPVLYDLGLHPQFYTYNHVWGGVLGPIYDEELAVRPGLFWFRGLTLLWAAVLVLLGRRAGEEGRGGGVGEETRHAYPSTRPHVHTPTRPHVPSRSLGAARRRRAHRGRRTSSRRGSGSTRRAGSFANGSAAISRPSGSTFTTTRPPFLPANYA